MLYAYLNEDKTIEKVEDLRDDPPRVRKLSDGTPKVRPVIYDNPPIAPWQEIKSWQAEVLNDSVIYHGIATDKDVAALKAERKAQVVTLLARKKDDGGIIDPVGAVRLNDRDVLRLFLGRHGRLPKWKLKDGTHHEFPNRNRFEEFVQAVADAIMNLEEKSEEHETAIDGLTTARAVVEYNIEQGW